MVTERIILSCRMLVFIFVFSGMPGTAWSDDLGDSAHDLARKIEAAVFASGGLACDFRNVSALDPGDVARIEQAIQAGLQGRCVRGKENDNEAANIVVTLSENFAGLVWSAEIRQGSEDREIVQFVPRSAVPPQSTRALPIVLTGNRLWEGPKRILDAVSAVGPGGNALDVLLLTDAVIVRNIAGNSESRIEVPLAIPMSTLREPSGSFSLQVGDSIDAKGGQRECAISLSALAVVKCGDASGQNSASDAPDVTAGQAVSASANCSQGEGRWTLVTGTGDDTQPDFIQAVVTRNFGAPASSNRVDFPGPVVSLHAERNGESATAIVKNPRTGSYEAYRLSISCGS